MATADDDDNDDDTKCTSESEECEEYCECSALRSLKSAAKTSFKEFDQCILRIKGVF